MNVLFLVPGLIPRKHRCDVVHAPIAFDFAQQLGLIDAVIESNIVEFQIAANFMQRKGSFFFSDISRQVDDLEDALEGNHTGTEFHWCSRQPLQ